MATRYFLRVFLGAMVGAGSATAGTISDTDLLSTQSGVNPFEPKIVLTLDGQREKIVYDAGYSLCPDSPEKLCQEYLASLSLPTKMDHWWGKVSGQISSIPEPGTGLLLGVGLAGLAPQCKRALQARG